MKDSEARSTRHETRNRKNKPYFLLQAICFLLLFSFQPPTFSFDDRYLVVKSKDSKADKKEEPEVKKEPINESEYEPVLVGALLENPEKYLNKKIKFRGKFSSFTALALDYEPAMRASKDYISICIFSNDSKVPLSELKLAFPVKEAKENQVIRELEESDLIEIYGKSFSAALGEPWVDILEIKKLESANKKTEKEIKEVKEPAKSQDKKSSDKKDSKKKKSKKESK